MEEQLRTQYNHHHHQHTNTNNQQHPPHTRLQKEHKQLIDQQQYHYDTQQQQQQRPSLTSQNYINTNNNRSGYQSNRSVKTNNNNNHNSNSNNTFQDHPIVNMSSSQQLTQPPYELGVDDCDQDNQVFTPQKYENNGLGQPTTRRSFMDNYSKQVIKYNTNDHANMLLRQQQQQQDPDTEDDNNIHGGGNVLNKNSKEEMIHSIQNELNQRKKDLREFIEDLHEYDSQSRLSKRVIGTINSLEEFLNLTYDAIKMQELDIKTFEEQTKQQIIEAYQLRDEINQLIDEKQDLLTLQETQTADLKQTILTQEQQILTLKQELDQRHQDYELLKQQLLIKDTLHLAQEQMQNQRQYFENIAFQNNHLQLELKRISEQFREYVQKHESTNNTVKVNNNGDAKKQQVLDEKFYVNKVDINELYEQVISTANQSKNHDLKDIINEKFKGRVKIMLEEQEYGMLITSQMRLIHDLVKTTSSTANINTNNENCNNYYSNNELLSNQTQYTQSNNMKSSSIDSLDELPQHNQSLSKHDILQINDLDNHYRSYIQAIGTNNNTNNSNDKHNSSNIYQTQPLPLSTNRSQSKNKIGNSNNNRTAKSIDRYTSNRALTTKNQQVRFSELQQQNNFDSYSNNKKPQMAANSNNNSRKNTPYKENEGDNNHQQQQVMSHVRHEKCLTRDSGKNRVTTNTDTTSFDISKELRSLKSQSPDKTNNINNFQKQHNPKDNLKSLIQMNQNAQQYQQQQKSNTNNKSQTRISTQKDMRLTKAQQKLQSDNIVLLEYLEPNDINNNTNALFQPVLQNCKSSSILSKNAIVSNNNTINNGSSTTTNNNKSKSRSRQTNSRQQYQQQYDYERTSFNQQVSQVSPMKSNTNISNSNYQSVISNNNTNRNTTTDMFSPTSQRDRTISPDKLKSSTSPNKLYNLGITNKEFKPLQRSDSSQRRRQTPHNNGQYLQKNQSQKSIGVYKQQQQQYQPTGNDSNRYATVQQQKYGEVQEFSPETSLRGSINNNKTNSNGNQQQQININNIKSVSDQDRQQEIKRQITQRAAADKMKQKYLQKQGKK